MQQETGITSQMHIEDGFTLTIMSGTGDACFSWMKDNACQNLQGRVLGQIRNDTV